ncbi:hypothetical protein [Streptomyces sp. UH6]|uniref:hypothetical protein n=1 Tax=Streptomyces sp. UH6 TaxID=2748379 RepID=UPI0015D471FC|nr:hypothetical protein [Streptomyces sp. UH6]NYV75084.1 hypothetical protein [Streptomyces sp. UH6]
MDTFHDVDGGHEREAGEGEPEERVDRSDPRSRIGAASMSAGQFDGEEKPELPYDQA